MSEFHGIRADSALDAFCLAAVTGKVKEMELLLTDGVDIDAIADYSKSTALASAASQGRMKSVDFLLEYGANIDKPGGHDLTPLMQACSSGGGRGSKMALHLIETGADINYVREADGMTALKFAVDRCKPEVVQALLERGAEVDGPAGTSQTALMLAARANNVDALKLLVEHGADVNLTCGLPWAENRTALGLAEMERKRKAVEYLSTLDQ